MPFTLKSMTLDQVVALFLRALSNIFRRRTTVDELPNEVNIIYSLLELWLVRACSSYD